MIDQREAAKRRVIGPGDGVSTPLPTHDVRRKRPPVISFLVRVETLRKVARVSSLLVLDYAAVTGAMVTALWVKLALHGHANLSAAWDQSHTWFGFAYLVTVLLFARADLYAERSRRPGLGGITTALFQTTVVTLVFALANGEHFQSYYIFYGSLFFGVVYVTGLRYLHLGLTGWMLETAGYRRRAVLVGSGEHIEAVAHALSSRSKTQVDVIGYISLTPRPQNGLRSLGPLSHLPTILREEHVQEVIIADPDFPQDRAVELVDLCHNRGVTVHVAPSTMEILIKRAEFVPGESVPLFTLRPPVFEGIDFLLKRTFDLVLSVLIIIVLSPALLAIALAIKLTSRGPVIYRSIRPGMGGRPFNCLKFRTMRQDSEHGQAELEGLNEASGALFKIRDDPRVTAVGAFLRHFSLDELPQLINVLRGEMSLVGPRPLPMRDFELLEEWHKKRYRVLPGMTGLWQVSGVYARAHGRLAHIAEPFSQRARERRLDQLLTLAHVTPQMRILDVGCASIGLRGLAPQLDITGVDVVDRPEYPGPFVAADATAQLPFEDGEFDLVYANSVIEHIPVQRHDAFAQELRRVARGWYVQTPAIGFPIEPHSLLPGAHWLPPRARAAYWRFGAGSDPDEIHLLRRRELEALFGPAFPERFGGFTKSWICLHPPAPRV